MSDTPPEHTSADLLSLLHDLRTSPARVIQSPPTQPRRASVALILRLRPAEDLVFEGHEPEGYEGEVIPENEFGLGYQLDDFLRLPWVNHPHTIPELLFIRRANPPQTTPAPHAHHRWASHIAFPGGRQEPDDASSYFTALRETWEEIGIDLAERDFLHVGRLDEREVTTSLGKRLLMILSPFVFLQTSPFSPTPELQATEISSVHWIPLSLLTPPYSQQRWAHIPIDISTRLSPRNGFIRWCLRNLIGKMEFGCLLLPDEPDAVAEGFDPQNEFDDEPPEGSGSWTNSLDGSRVLRLWGLTLGMTLDLISHYPTTSTSASSQLLLASRPPPNSLESKPQTPTTEYQSSTPRTPVTVTSSFEDQWEKTRKALEEVKEGGGGRRHGGGGQGSVNVGVEVEEKGKRVEKAERKRKRRGVGPRMTAVFPRFSYPDVNFWIWVFGRRYRQVIRGWENSTHGPDRAADRRVNWSGQALATFYSAVRQALVVAIIIRALLTGAGVAGITFVVLKKLGWPSEL
ncbi:hypothetical protein IAT38_002500 [Cryptococcus sp. DSM 104549]